MAPKIVEYWIGWVNGPDPNGRKGFVKLKLEGGADAELRVASLAELSALNEILRSTRPLHFDAEKQLIQSEWQRVA